MGCVLSVRSQESKAGKSCFSYLLAHRLSLLPGKPVRVLLCTTGTETGGLPSLPGAAAPAVEMEDLVNIGTVCDGERLNLYSMLERQGSIYFVGSSRSGPSFAARYPKAYAGLIQEFRGLFDIVLLDGPSGSENILGRIFMEECDHSISLLRQEVPVLENQIFRSRKDIAYIVNKYMGDLPPAGELTAPCLQGNIFCLPYCGRLSDAFAKKRLDIYLQLESEFNSVLKNIACEVACKVGIRREVSAAVPVKRRMAAAVARGLF